MTETTIDRGAELVGFIKAELEDSDIFTCTNKARLFETIRNAAEELCPASLMMTEQGLITHYGPAVPESGAVTLVIDAGEVIKGKYSYAGFGCETRDPSVDQMFSRSPGHKALYSGILEQRWIPILITIVIERKQYCLLAPLGPPMPAVFFQSEQPDEQ